MILETIRNKFYPWRLWAGGLNIVSTDDGNIKPAANIKNGKLPVNDREQAKAIINNLLRGLDFDFTWYSADCDFVVRGIEDYVDAMRTPLEPQFLKIFNKCKPVAAKFAVSFYPLHPADLQIQMAIGVLLITTIDDVCDLCHEDVGLFQKRLVLREPQGNSLLEHYATFLREWNESDSYGPYSTSMIMKSSLDFIGGCYLESVCASEMPVSATGFPRFLRLKTGYSEYFVHLMFPGYVFPENEYLQEFVFAVPELIDITDYINDALSFYKESIAGVEDANFLCNFGRTHGMSPVEALRHHCDKVVKSVRRVRSIVKDEQVLRYINAYITGYIHFHLTLERYKMSELLCR